MCCPARYGVALLLFLGCTILPASAQRDTVIVESTDSAVFRRHIVYAEGWGISSVVGIHYERSILQWKAVGLLARAGVATIHLRDFTRRWNPDIILPVGAVLTLGRIIQADAGAGVTITSLVYPDEETFAPNREQAVHGWASIGVRTGNAYSRIFGRGGMNLLLLYGRTDLNFSLSLGYRF